MLIKDVLQKTTLFFREKGYETARLDTEILLSTALHWDRMKLYLNYDYPLNEEELTACRALVKRRAAGEPVAYITGERDFYNHTFLVAPGVLIPRPETETLVESVLAWAKTDNQSKLNIIDLGSGTGCIGLSLLAELSAARLLAVDIAEAAFTLTTTNAEKLGVSERALIRNQRAEDLTADDVISYFGALADIVVANPPYISLTDPEVEANVRKFEPAEALFSEESGLAHIRAWSAQAAKFVRPGGLVMFEIGHDQGAEARTLFMASKKNSRLEMELSSQTSSQGPLYEQVEIVRDLSGRDRFIKCFRTQL